MAFTEAEYTDLLTWGGTTATTVLDSDGLKMALHNLWVNTDLSDTGDWTHTRLDSVVESGTSPSGAAAYLVTEDNTASNTHTLNDSAKAFSAGATYSVVFDVKANGRDEITITLASLRFGTAVAWDFDLGGVTVTQVTAGTNDSASITLISDGWYRCVMTADCTSSGSSGDVIVSLHNGTSTSYTGDGSSGLYLSRPRIYQSAVHAPIELVENGTFDTDTSGWADGGIYTATAAAVSGELQITPTVNFGAFLTPISVVAGKTYVASGDIRVVSGAGIAQMLITNSDGTNTAVGVSGHTASSTAISAGFIFTAASTGTLYLAVRNYTAATGMVIGADNVSVVEVLDDGMQLGSDGTDYLDTGDAGPLYTPGVAYDDNGSCLGLQSFEARTNLVTYSNDFSNADWTKSSVVVTQDETSPDGSVNAWKIESASADTDNVSQPSSGHTVSADHTSSIYIKAGTATQSRLLMRDGVGTGYANIDWTGSVPAIGTESSATGVITAMADGYYRVSLTMTLDGSATYVNLELQPSRGGAGYIYVYGAQLEAGSFPTPYIPTGSAAVARGAHSTTKALSEFGYNQTEGTLVATFLSLDATSPHGPFDINDGTANNRIGVYVDGSNFRSFVTSGGVAQANSIIGSSFAEDTEFTIATAYKADDFSGSVDGATAVTDTAGTVPTVATLELARATLAGTFLNGFIKKLVYYPSRLSDSTLESESS